MNIKEIREMNPDELPEELEHQHQKLFDLRSQAVTEKLEDPTQLIKIKRTIARIKTVLRERELAAEAQTAAAEK